MKLLWIGICLFLGAAIGATLLGLRFDSLLLAIVGAVGGGGLGALFGRFIPFDEVLISWFD